MADILAPLAGHSERIIYWLAIVYLSYALAHTVVALLAGRKCEIMRATRKACEFILALLIFIISGLYGLDYLVMRLASAA